MFTATGGGPSDACQAGGLEAPLSRERSPGPETAPHEASHAADRSGSPPGKRWRRLGAAFVQLSRAALETGSPARTGVLLAVGAYLALRPTTPRVPGAPVWVATGFAVAVGLAVARFQDERPGWLPWATLAAVAGLFAASAARTTAVLLLALLLLTGVLLRLPVRAAVRTAAIALGLGVLAGLRVRLLTGQSGPLLAIMLGYALTFTAVLAVRERRRHQEESEGLMAELAREHHDLEEAYARLREYAHHAAELAASEERNRIAREIHDVLAHALTVMIVQAEAAAVRLRSDPPGAAEQVRGVADLARSALQEARLSVAAMRADAGTAGIAALRRLCEDASRVGDMRCALRIDGHEQGLPAPVALAAYRIVQEAITNARRHGGAGRVDVVLGFAGEGLTLRVTDDGSAAGPRDPVGGSGLRGMAERVRALGGTFRAGPRVDGAGFEVAAELPLLPAAEADAGDPATGGDPAGVTDPAAGGDPAGVTDPATGGDPAGVTDPATGGDPAGVTDPAAGGDPAGSTDSAAAEEATPT